jgi:hypothetical protein
VVALPGQPHLGEVRHHSEFLGVPVLAQPEPGHRGVRRPGLAAARAEVAALDPRGDLRHGEGRHRRPRVTAGVAVLQPAGEHHVERRARHHAKLTGG